MRAAILLGNSENLSGGQIFLALDTGHTITWYQWVVLPMSPAIIARVNLFRKAELSILTFTDRHGHKIGDYPREPKPVEDDDDPVMEYINDAIPAIDTQDDPEIPGVWEEPTGEPTSKPIVEPTGVEMRWTLIPKRLTLMMDSDNRTRQFRHHQPRLYLKTLHRLPKEWQHAMPG
jgi:hypothetical protein